MRFTSELAPATTDRLPFHVVGIGASAGGLDALEKFISNVPADSGFAYVIVQHLSPDYKSMMAELLARHTTLPVRVIEHGMAPLPNTVSLIPPRVNLTLQCGVFDLAEKPTPPTLNLPIDIFFKSLARECGDKAVGVILSGTGSDGTRGVRSIREAGGLVLVQTPATAQFDGMARSALSVGGADLVAPPEELPLRLLRLARDGQAEVDLVSTDDSRLEALRRVVQLIQKDTGVNFAQYKQTTVGRRIARRMAVHQMGDPQTYLALAQDSADEREALYRDLLIGVTRFFRDREVWGVLRDRVIRPLVADPNKNGIRMWVAGCSSGEEAYTLAMVLHEEIRSQHRTIDVKIFATDIDQAAVERASRGVYPESIVADIEPERIARYFIRHGDTFEVNQTLRQMILFAHHNLTRDPPFTRLDLITCRNVLIYFDTSLQERVIGGFHFGLRAVGSLLLGTSETVGELADRFTPLDPKHKLFRAVGARTNSTWLAGLGDGDSRTATSRRQLAESLAANEPSRTVDVALATLLDQYGPPALLIDEKFHILHVFGTAGSYLRLQPGRPALLATEMTSPEVAAVLTSGVPRSIRSGETALFQPVAAGPNGMDIAVRILPFRDSQTGAGLAVVAFEEPREEVGRDVVQVNDDVTRQLAELHRELKHSEERHQTLAEELETANEELQAANEELLASNEELLASNEELQATNEELQSVNEELHTVNAEFQHKIRQLEQATADLDHLLVATDIGTLFLDQNLAIRKFTPSVAEFLPLLDRDVGRPIDHLANELGGPAFLAEVREVFHTGVSRERSIDSRTGPVLVRIRPYQARGATGVVITFTNVSEVKRTFEVARRVLDSLPAQVAFLAADGMIRMVNRAWEKFAEENGGRSEMVGVGTNYFRACAGDPTGDQVVAGIRKVLVGEMASFTLEYPCDSDTEKRWFVLRCTPTTDGHVVVAHFDVTPQKKAEAVLNDLATHDHLTGVLNRRGLDRQLSIELNRQNRTGSPLAALLLDCDNFKRVNDNLGLAAGDTVLATVARRIEQVLRPGDILARIGGDEFVILLPEVRAAEAAVVAERVRLAVSSRAVAVSHQEIDLTISLALAAIDRDILTLENLLDRVRYALKISKSQGKNRVAVVPSGGDLVSLNGTRQELVGLLAEGAMGVAYQPIVTLANGNPVGYELLTRVSKMPNVGPQELFQLAQEEGLLALVDQRCLSGCLSACHRLPHGSWRHVNLYPSTLLHIPVDAVGALFPDSAAGRYCVELSEQQILGDPSYMLLHLRALREAGVRVAIDDVGFGRTALESLIILEPEIVKIDRTYVRGVATDVARRRWLHRLVGVAGSLGSTLIAEGIETEDDAVVLRDLGVTHGQGYYYGRPTADPIPQIKSAV